MSVLCSAMLLIVCLFVVKLIHLFFLITVGDITTACKDNEI